MTGSLVRLLLCTGIVAPILFGAVFTADGALKPGYLAISEAVSYLEVGAYGLVQVVNFAVMGALTIGFSLGIALAMRGVISSRARWLAAAFLALSGAGYLVASAFPPAAFGQSQTALVPTLHTVAFELVFFGLGPACAIIAVALMMARRGRFYAGYSLVTRILLLLPPLGNLYSLTVPTQQAVFSNPQHFQFGGIFNRIVLAIAFAWYLVTAIRLLRSSARQPPIRPRRSVDPLAIGAAEAGEITPGPPGAVKPEKR